MLLIKAFSQFANRCSVALGVAFCSRIIAVLDGRDDGDRAGACLIAGQNRTGPEAHPARTSPGAKLHHEAFPPAGHHTQAKARDPFVPKEELGRLRLDSVDDAFGQFRHWAIL
jgi:hypothetical protein